MIVYRIMYNSDNNYEITHTLSTHTTSTSSCARNAVVSCTVWGVALSWTYTKFRPKMSVAQGAYCRGEAWCNIGGWGFHPAPPVHSSHHGEWHPILWLRGRCYRPWVGCMHLSVSPLACGSNELDHHCETAWSEIHHWRHSAWSPAFCEFSPHMAASPVIQSQSWIPGGRPRPISSIQKHVYNSPNWQPPPKLADHLHAQTKSRMGKRLSLTIQMKCLASPTSTPLLVWPISVSVASQNCADTSLWHTRHSCYFLLTKAPSRQSYNTHQDFLLQITWHDAIREW